MLDQYIIEAKQAVKLCEQALNDVPDHIKLFGRDDSKQLKAQLYNARRMLFILESLKK